MILLLLLIPVAGAFGQTGGFAALRLPGFFDSWFGNEAAVIDLPARPVNAFEIEVREPAARVGAGAIAVLVNGKGIGNILMRRPSEHGVILSVSPAALANRPDPIFDPEENVVEVSAKERAGRVHYQSWVLRTRSIQTNPYFAWAGSVSPRDPAGVPPDISLEVPAAPPVLDQGAKGQVRVKGLAAAGTPGVSLQINGHPRTNEARKTSVSFDEMVPVTPEMQQVVIAATDSKGHQSSVTIPVVRRSPPVRRARLAGNRYAILIGISRFGPLQETKGVLPHLPGPATAAQSLARILEKTGFPRDNIRVLTDEDGTADQIRAAFSDLATRTGPDDFVLVFVATQAGGDPAQPGGMFLACYGTREGQWRSTGLEIGELQTLLNRNVRSGQALAIFDVAGGPVRNIVNNRAMHFFDDQEGRAVLVSGMADQTISTELFASQLAASFSPKADLNGDRILTADESLRYVVSGVQTASNGAQTPRFRLSVSGPPPALYLPDERMR